jgi:2-amino-4-hydroxy-6-hydroxymethyldihydropteridine diphosphokinase
MKLGHESIAYVALGANIKEPLLQLQRAVQLLRDIADVKKVSSVYLTRPFDTSDEQPNYYNMAVELVTSVTPLQFIEQLQQIEAKMGRQRTVKNAARCIDLDLIFFGEQIIDTPELQLPHPRAHERDFVLRPLMEINTFLSHPRLNCPLKKLLEQLPQTTVIQRLEHL